MVEQPENVPPPGGGLLDSREEQGMEGIYRVVMAAILLFPWSVVLTMLVATVCHRTRAFVRMRYRRGVGHDRS
jgi:hypothetical protein